MLEMATDELILLLARCIGAITAIYIFSGSSKNQRFYTGVHTAALSGVICYGTLLHRFADVGLPLAIVALWILTFTCVGVGMAIGTILPYLLPGVNLGISLVLLQGMYFGPGPSIYVSTAVLIFAVAVCSILCMRGGRFLTFILSTSIIGGGFATMFFIADLFPDLAKIVHGYQNNSVTTDRNLLLALLWTSLSFVSLVCLVLRDNTIRFSTLIASSRAGVSVSNNNGFIEGLRSKDQKQTISSPNTDFDTYNMFDQADLPHRLAEFANMVYDACEDLGNFFGFQDSSVRNQAEHILILLSNNRRYISMPSVYREAPSPIHALHSKVFSNYRKWCKSLGIRPHFSRMSSMTMTVYGGSPAIVSQVIDLVLYFCCWGEAGNIRHMPECLWFLYHKMMEEYCQSDKGVKPGSTGSGNNTRSLYAGHYLDKVVTPIYKIVSSNMKSKADHVKKRNYDDFNEFFWSKQCLKHDYCARDETDIESSTLPGDEPAAPISQALLNAPKTFLEKRSWLRGVLALYRVIEWHIVTFYLLIALAFSIELIWNWVYSLQVASGVFWIINLLQIMWSLLEVWASHPDIQLASSSIQGTIFSLLSRTYILVLQTLYLMWVFDPNPNEGINPIYWWWQYVWLSSLCIVPYMIGALLQLYPESATRMYTSPSDYVQSFLSILYPLSRIYVAKEVHESLKRSSTYIFFWITLLTWKLYFSYLFEVSAMVGTTLGLTDDYINYRSQSFAAYFSLLILRWSPAFLVYTIDLSIWYSVWQAFAGTAVGFKERLGAVRSMKDIRNNFVRAPEHFCRKMLSPDAGSRRGSGGSLSDDQSSSNNKLSNPNLPEGQSLLGSDPHNLQRYVNRLLDVRIQKWVMFSAAWNEIIDTFREEDILSDAERDNLKFSRFEGFSQAVYLPVFQTAGVFENTMADLERNITEYKITKGNDGPIDDKEIFEPILSHVTASTAISEVWELGCYVMLQLLGRVHNDDMVAVMNLALKWTESSTLNDHVRIEKLRSVVVNFVGLVNILKKGIRRRTPSDMPRKSSSPRHKKNTVLAGNKKNSGTAISNVGMRKSASYTSLQSQSVDGEANNLSAINNALDLNMKRVTKKQNNPSGMKILDSLRDQARDKVRAMISAIKDLTKDIDKESRQVVDCLTFILKKEDGFLWDDMYASDQLDRCAKDPMFFKVVAKVHGLVACHPDDVEPKSKEVHRRLTFFVNSLFMDIPEAPSIRDMFSWNVLTPFYSEDVTYNKADLEKRTDALGVSTLLYLQTLYRDDWSNFLERMNIKNEENIWSKKNIEQTRIWASLRSQTLTRTVHGMMYYEKALRLLANLERLDDNTTNNLMGEKFGYVVACQVYGNMKRNQDAKADDIEQLMHRFPHMRVAYIDSVRRNRSGDTEFYSVLVKSNREGDITEIYRVRLPGNPVLGEGKPENQNSAIIFTRGEFVQTIDMNQEGYFEEALKMRNALQEFTKRKGPLPTTILGLREHIFTGSVSSLANYMALQETSFVTLGQRVLTKPLCIRLHYGHPDVFDKLFFMTRGGISKSSKGINLSEDIFAGFNNLLRGGQVAFEEYLQVGKGRDVGMSQIYKFEAKLSQGAGEQSLSRDVYRIGHRLDFFRLFSLVYGGIGHYFSNVLTVLTVYVVSYLMLVLALFKLERIGDRPITPQGTIQLILGGLGLLQTIPLFATLGVERGWWNSFREIVGVFVSGGPFHFMFHIQTKAYYMIQTIFVGGAKYRATGRGFVTQHTPMDEQFRFFASSHLYLGIELAACLMLMGLFTEAKQYVGRTWSMWLAALSFLLSPFWFNPLTFDLSLVLSDYYTFLKWAQASSGSPQKSWWIWWKEENSFYKKMKFSSKFIFFVKSFTHLLVGIGIFLSDLYVTDLVINTPFIKVTKILTFVGVFMLFAVIFLLNENHLPYAWRRSLGMVIAVCISVGTLLIFVEDSDYFRYAMSGYYVVGAFCQIGLLVGVDSVQYFYFVHDMILGHVVFVFLFGLGALRFPHYIQTQLLYHNALSQNVVVSDILRYARKSQESAAGLEADEDLVEQVTELRKLVQKQQQMLSELGDRSTVHKPSPMGSRNASTDAITAFASGSSTEDLSVSEAAGGKKSVLGTVLGKVQSMSGLDVWSDMAGTTTQQGVSENTTYQPAIYQAKNVNKGFSFSQPDVMPPR